jgi:tRNA uridine 5-carbamoylmethylation protein Kti12
MITIRIEGPPGEGKTQTAIAIMRLLRDMKQEVKYQGRRYAKEAVDEFVKEPLPVQAKEFKLKRKFLVVDMFDDGSLP